MIPNNLQVFKEIIDCADNCCKKKKKVKQIVYIVQIGFGSLR